MHTAFVIFLTVLIVDTSGKIQNEADSNSVLLEYQANGDMDFQEIHDKYMKDFYERIDEFRKTRNKYKEGKGNELVGTNRGNFNDDNQVDSTVDHNESGNEDSLYKSGSIFGGWLPPHPPPPPPPPEKQWGRSDVNDYFNVGHQPEKSFMKKSKLSKIGERGQGASIPTDDIKMISMTLHPSRRPFFNFTVTSNTTLYIFEVPHERERNYLLSVVVEKMNCRAGRSNSAKLYIGGENGESDLCKEIDDASNRFQSTSHVFDGDELVNVTGSGDWSAFNVSANLVVSIYYEASSCPLCETNGHFCCGRKENSCNFIPSKKTGTTEAPLLVIPKVYDLRRNLHQQHFRCIPKEDVNGTSLLCNGHPNCGFHCNLDELKGNCPKKDEDGNDKDDDYNNCLGYYCREYGQDRVLVTILLLVLFCVFVPFCIFLFLCGRRDMRRELGTRGRCPLPLEILFCPFSMSSDSVPEGATAASTAAGRSGRDSNSSNQTRRQQRVRGNVRRARRSEEVYPPSASATPAGMDNFSFFDDLPPSYAECIGNKEMYPNPLTLAELPTPPSRPPRSVVVIPETIAPHLTATTVTLANSRENSISQRASVPASSTTPQLAVSSRSQETTFAELHSPQATPEGDLRSSHVCQCSKHRNPVIVEESEAELGESESSRRGQEQRRSGDSDNNVTRY